MALTEVTAVLGRHTEPRFVDRAVDELLVGWGDATKHHRLVCTSSGRELALRLPRRSFLADGDVLADDGATIVVVRRPAEDAIVVSFADNPGAVRATLRLGYTLGNQHTPLEITDTELRTPLLTSPATARAMLAELGLVGSVCPVPLAAHGWTTTSADHRHAPTPEHGTGNGHG